MPANTLGYDAVAEHAALHRLERRHDARQRPAVALRRAGPRAEQAALGRPDAQRVLHAGAASVGRRRRRARRRSRPRTARRRLDFFRGDADYGNVAFTRRHRFVSTFLYELPFGRDRRFASGIGRGLDALVGGWDVTGVTLFQSGPFLTPFFSNGDPSGTGTTVRGFTPTQRPDQVGDGNLVESDRRRVLRSQRVRPCRPTTSAASATPRSASLVGPGHAGRSR